MPAMSQSRALSELAMVKCVNRFRAPLFRGRAPWPHAVMRVNVLLAHLHCHAALAN
jgi:hypothetical protein